MIYVDDALAHGGAYALAAFLAVLGWGAAWGSALCLGLVGVGGAIEILQAALPTGHEGEWADMLANACGIRSEEHTSELQSLMRISYAVFCLKKKKQHRITDTKRRIY